MSAKSSKDSVGSDASSLEFQIMGSRFPANQDWTLRHPRYLCYPKRKHEAKGP
jgi:hypothetical protein